ncbi:MAG: EthD family reductase [Bradyrhizobiaceae bacterium]|nr:EthD family reductase [Bradyrhizobiaceae bacterium]
MIKVSVMYPNKPGVRFDHEYYRTKHLPLIKSRMGAGLKYYTIDKGLADKEGRPLNPDVAMCHLLCDSVEEYQSSFGPHAQEIREDIANFTDATPIHQISQVVVENSSIGVAGGPHRGPVDQHSLPHMSDQVSR